MDESLSKLPRAQGVGSQNSDRTVGEKVCQRERWGFVRWGKRGSRNAKVKHERENVRGKESQGGITDKKQNVMGQGWKYDGR